MDMVHFPVDLIHNCYRVGRSTRDIFYVEDFGIYMPISLLYKAFQCSLQRNDIILIKNIGVSNIVTMALEILGSD